MLRGTKAVKRLRALAFIFVVSGLSLASLYASRREPPLVRIGEIKPIMNFSTVRVQGFLESEARTLRDGAVLYLLADESGSLPVFLHCALEGIPLRVGTRVSATGYLRPGAGNQVSMRVPRPGQITVLENAAPTSVRGQVAEVWAPPPDSRAPYRIILDRPEGRVEVVHWFAPEHRVAVGDRVDVQGTIGFYKGRMQLKVSHPGHLRLYPEG
jgi:hypothetical protein